MADIPLTPEEEFKFQIISQIINKEVKPGQAAMMLGISQRQVRRLREAVKAHGKKAVVHKLKRKPSNHHITETVKETALTIIQEKYQDFKPTFATEKLAENHNIHISYGTTRLWMIEKGLWKEHTQKKPAYRSWRPRKEYFGELIQFDGSYHVWFENRYSDETGTPLEVCLLAAIDDATGRMTKAEFTKNEGIHAVFTFWKEYIQSVRKPIAIYLDKFSTYKINHKSAEDNQELMTQFQMAMHLLGIQLITAHSPEAKGRVERLFGTLQDRLVKEMRLANIATPSDGNKFLNDVFLPKFNAKFGVIPAKEGNVHKQLLPQEKKQLNHIFSVKKTRRINLDYTIQFKNKWYQLLEVQPTTVRPLERATMEIWLDETIHIMLRGHQLFYMLLPERPKKQTKQPPILTTHRLNYKPPANHPWRQYKK